jgi:hypothetical protein
LNPLAAVAACFKSAISNIWRSHKIALITFTGSLAIFEHIWGSRFYSSQTHVGHDFAGSAINILEGKFWLDSNGFWAGLFNPPWFTPAWCAGSAFYADPQSLFYTPLQAFGLFFDPIFATHLSTLLFAAVGFWGSYALARKVFLWTQRGAVVFAVLGIANAFLPLRSAVGESGYQSLYLWTLLALALCWPNTKGQSNITSRLWPALSVCLALTGWLQFGFAGMMVPAFLATLLLCFTLVIAGKADFWTVIARSAIGGLMAITLNASKLYEASSLMRNFPRSFYELPGFPNFSDALLATAFSLIQPSEWTAHFGLRRLVNVQFTALPHEWALHFGLGAVALAAVAAIVAVLSSRKRLETPFASIQWSTSKTLALIGIIAIAVIPPLLMWSDGGIRALIKQIPILNSAAWPMRWIVLLLPITQIILALPIAALLDRRSARVSTAGLVAATLLIWSGPFFEPVGYYLDPRMQYYPPKGMIEAFKTSRTTGPIPITAIVVEPNQNLPANRNDTMLQGVSQGVCYNPLYGYRLEMLPQKEHLRSGPVFGPRNTGETLINNPACLVHSVANSCKPGAGFVLNDANQMVNASRFLNRKPYEWQRPLLGTVLSMVSQVCFGLLVIAFLCRLLGWTVRMRK